MADTGTLFQGGSRPRLLDLFCGGGGVGTGYYLAGFEIVGVDIAKQPRFPFAFFQADALEFVALYGDRFDAIHASPPCQAYSRLAARHPERVYPDLVEPTREALQATGLGTTPGRATSGARRWAPPGWPVRRYRSRSRPRTASSSARSCFSTSVAGRSRRDRDA